MLHSLILKNTSYYYVSPIYDICIYILYIYLMNKPKRYPGIWCFYKKIKINSYKINDMSL